MAARWRGLKPEREEFKIQNSRFQVMKLHGVFPPVTTPFEAGGDVSVKHLRANVQKYNATGVAGYVALGSTGEAVLLTWPESERVLATVAEAAAPGKILIAGTGVDSTSEAIERTNRAAALGYHVALVRTPFYYKPQMKPEALEAFYVRVADAAKIPILIYSVPVFTGMNVEAPLIARLAKHPNIIGIKESSGNVKLAGEIVTAAGPGFQTLVGSAQTFYGSLQAGAVGGILGIACVLPELCVELHRASMASDARLADELQQRLHAPSVLIVSQLGVPAVKYGMDCVGYFGGEPRSPLLPLTEAQKQQLREVLAPNNVRLAV